jgi:hypothetical protein
VFLIGNSFGCGSYDSYASAWSTWNEPVFRCFPTPASMAASQYHQPPNQSKVDVLIGNENESPSRRCDTPPGLPRYGLQRAILNSDGKLEPAHHSGQVAVLSRIRVPRSWGT